MNYPDPKALTAPAAVVIGTDQTGQFFGQFPTLSLDELDSDQLPKQPLLLVDGTDQEFAAEAISAIRQHANPGVYLLPIVLLSNGLASGIRGRSALSGADHVCLSSSMDRQAIEQLYEQFYPLHRWIDSLPPQPVGDTNLALKTLRLLASRGNETEPVMTSERLQGFSYPLIEKLFSQADQSIQQTLDYLAKLNLLSPRFVTRVHQCIHCASSFLNFKETCPQCSAEDLQVDELVHHFRCAHTAPLSDYRQEGKLVCPKCEQTLKHIGVDYDKPSISYSCNSCRHSFSDPQILTSCFNCNRTTAPELLNHAAVNAFSVSAVGENAARHGIDNLFSSVMDERLQLVSTESFSQFLRVEQARISRYKVSESCLMLILIDDLEQLYLKVGERAPELFADIGEIFHRVLRLSDVITSRNDGFFVALLTETSAENGARALERLHVGIDDLLSENLRHTPTIRDAVIPVTTDLDYESELEKFLDSDDD